MSRLARDDEKWTVHDCALGAKEGNAEINVSEFSQFSSLLNANGYGNSNWDSMKVQHRQKINIETLDNCFDKGLIHAGKRFLLKMDTQGYDLEVFKGGKKSLASVCCPLSEMSLIPIYEGMPHYLESLSTYEDAGFKVSGFYPITRNLDLSLNEVDCMLVNTESFDHSQ